MVGVSKFYDKRAALKDIYHSYFYGAKIGAIGLNGEAVSSPGYAVGYLQQEPLINDWRTVRQVVEEAGLSLKN